VTAVPSVLARVSEYIERQNKRLSQLVTIDVKVLQVTMSNDSSFGLNLTAAVESTSGLSFSANPLDALAGSSANSMSIAVLNSASSLSELAGSEALVQALAKQGKVSLVTNVGVTTRSNRVAPVSNTRTRGYIKRFESRNFTTVESSTVDQEDLETGFTMQLLPNVLDNGKILLLFRMSVRELLNMASEKIGEVVLQLPEVEERSFMQEVIMESGQMLVVSGFEKQTNSDNRSGLGDPDFMALSGSRASSGSREVLAVILTPQVLVSPMDAERNIQQHWGAPLN
jgi:type IVB pilus formation R64 PilN family outer membrane protein